MATSAAIVFSLGPAGFAHEQGRLLTQLVVWMVEHLRAKERDVFLAGVWRVIQCYTPAPKPRARARRKRRA